MKLVVLGASGKLGRAVVGLATARGHEVVAVTRRPAVFAGAANACADVVSGEGLDAALAGADTVVNAVNAQRGAKELLVDGTRRLLETATRLGVRHHVAVSIVGIEKVPLAYYGVKLAEEAVVQRAPIGWSILRATQFHPFIAGIFEKTASFGFVVAGIGVKLQPIDPRDVAAALVAAAEAGPSRRLPDLGGPEVLTMRALARQWLAATKRTRLVLPAPLGPGLLAALRDGGLCAPERAVGEKTFAAWLGERVTPA